MFNNMAPRTRSGRLVKRPVAFTPTEETLVDDYLPDEHDTDLDSDIDTEDEYDSEDGEDSSDDEDSSDADENGNLKDFVIDDDEESEESDDENEE